MTNFQPKDKLILAELKKKLNGVSMRGDDRSEVLADAFANLRALCKWAKLNVNINEFSAEALSAMPKEELVPLVWNNKSRVDRGTLDAIICLRS